MLAFGILNATATAKAAAGPASTITSPSDGTFVFRPRDPLPQIEGTATGMSKVDVNCYYGDGANVRQRVATAVTVAGGRFAFQFPGEQFEAGHACVLRAVPEGDTAWYPPGDGDPYVGPRITESSESIATYEPITHDRSIAYSYGDVDTSFVARTTIRSAGQCGLEESLLFSPGQLTPSAPTFRCDAGLRTPPHEQAAPTGITVDGISAFPPGAVYELNHEQPVASAPQISVAQTFDAATAEVTIDEHDPLAICSERPAQPEGCESWVSAGVELERMWHTTNGNQLALMADTWRSTDGHSHALAITYELGMNQGPAGGGFQFPGQTSLARFPAGLSISPPAGPATIFYSENLGTASAGDYQHPFTAITYSGSPSAYREVEEEFEWNLGEMHYQPMLPAGGSFSVQMGFSQAYSLEQVRALAAQAEAAMQAQRTGSGAGAPPPGPTRHAHIVLLGAKSAGTKIMTRLSCDGPVGSACTFAASLSSAERLRHGRAVAVAANLPKRARWRRVGIAHVGRSLPAGARTTVVLAPNKLGRRLLAHFHRLPVLLALAEPPDSRQPLRRREALLATRSVRRSSTRRG